MVQIVSVHKCSFPFIAELLNYFCEKQSSLIMIRWSVLFFSILLSFHSFTQKKIALMEANSLVKAEIYGNTLPGEDPDMARKRALEVYNYLINNGVEESRLIANYPVKDKFDDKQVDKVTASGEQSAPFKAKYEQTIHFGTNSKLVTEYSKGKLEKFFTYVQNNPNAKIYLSGHADHVGKEKYNLELSKKRVESVEAYFRSKGLKQEIRKEFFGESSIRFSQDEVKKRSYKTHS